MPYETGDLLDVERRVLECLGAALVSEGMVCPLTFSADFSSTLRRAHHAMPPHRSRASHASCTIVKTLPNRTKPVQFPAFPICDRRIEASTEPGVWLNREGLAERIDFAVAVGLGCSPPEEIISYSVLADPYAARGLKRVSPENPDGFEASPGKVQSWRVRHVPPSNAIRCIGRVRRDA